ncbi:Hpt domain-containing protein [Spirosoma agri]|jgi:HPt (histidine-containing phosphotransfer) domain-containing protein|uniref:Hpt domain-containing protein n=1 Tax=Spirosoma agri TaxID=1987381 RepID=A0A6M0IFE5_9BACT|nr:Hpt domain-containing protein [Spirosoma agri]NEU66986.1 Hpt domain-containing protein [Spirosoma agri]
MTTIVHSIDYERLRKLHSHDERLIINVLTLILDEVLPDFDTIEANIQKQEWAEAAHTAHQLIPWVGMAGLTSLENELRTFEQVAKRNPNADDIRSAWYQFRAGLDEAIPLLQQELTNLEGKR